MKARSRRKLKHPHRSRARITSDHLRVLAQIAKQERDDFFKRNPGQSPFYQRRFIAAALCQGAALHYLGLGTGVKDFDVHLFYEQHPVRRQMARAVRRLPRQIDRFGKRQVDIIRTVIPRRITRNNRGGIAVIRAFLVDKPTQNAKHLAQKPVIGLLPKAILARVVWPDLRLLRRRGR
ncbi:MAG TPA: hypothetical protein VFL31_07105 [Nitrospiraceae bacterium]|nr:hypothetical protein [Nitrospiraceae bacterium]